VLLVALLEQTAVHTVDISQHLWIPLAVPSAAHIAAAEYQLLQRLGRHDESPIVSRINRALSRQITRRLMHTSITPNQITVVSAFIGLCGALLLAQPSQLWQVCGGLLFLCSTIIDGCDGEIARLTFQESAFGAKFDIVMDNVVHLFLFPSIAIGLYRQYEAPVYLILGGLAMGGIVLSMIVYMPHRLRPHRVTSAQTRLHDSLASRDFAYILPVLAFVKGLSWFLWATVIGTYLFAIAWLVLAQRARQGAH
jgi:phosphatidylglycerophosphate synthase